MINVSMVSGLRVSHSRRHQHVFLSTKENLLLLEREVAQDPSTIQAANICDDHRNAVWVKQIFFAQGLWETNQSNNCTLFRIAEHLALLASS